MQEKKKPLQTANRKPENLKKPQPTNPNLIDSLRVQLLRVRRQQFGKEHGAAIDAKRARTLQQRLHVLVLSQPVGAVRIGSVQMVRMVQVVRVVRVGRMVGWSDGCVVGWSDGLEWSDGRKVGLMVPSRIGWSD